jgi:hypothetical protein
MQRKYLLPVSIAAVLFVAAAGFFYYKKYVAPGEVAVIDEIPESIISSVPVDTSVGGTPFSLTEIPYTDPDIPNPGRGAEEWYGMNQVAIPLQENRTEAYDTYYRFNWTSFENTTKGVYDWSVFDSVINKAIDKKQRFGFGIMTVYPGGDGNPGVVNYAGGFSSYPQWLHEAMQAEPVKDWIYQHGWIPNWNSETYLKAWEDLNAALNAHILEASYKGVKYKDVISYIDIRGYGAFGEWHNYPYRDAMPVETKPTASNLLRIIHATSKAYNSFQLVAMSDAFNHAGYSDMPPEVTYELLTGRNEYNEFGWRRDNWGDAHSWYPAYFEKNPKSYNGKAFKTLIMNKWRYAPVVGEPLQCCTLEGGECEYWELEDQVLRYHASSFGNGNLENPDKSCVIKNIIQASKASGYRLKILRGEAHDQLSKGQSFAIKTVWSNTGVAPVYDKNWQVIFELQTGDGKIQWSGISAIKLTSLLPTRNEIAFVDSFTLPAGISPGEYKLVIRIKDARLYMDDMRLAVKEKNADGSYTLLHKVIVK